ncbi:hypothetical protein, partial [Sphingorhabdus sp.]|uniref:hypothetical protein n=1 Tax=Sphingorhabdus sp. TaxID=1902408 RepID=UPI003340F079
PAQLPLAILGNQRLPTKLSEAVFCKFSWYFLTIAKCKAKELVPKWLGVTHIPLKPLSDFPCRDDGDLTVNIYNCSHHAASLFSEIACA